MHNTVVVMERNTPEEATGFVDPVLIMNDVEIREQNVVLSDFAFKDQMECILWLVRRKLLRNFCLCDVCHMNMCLNRKSEGTDQYNWKCKKCNHTVSIRRGSIFAHSHIPLSQILKIIYCWSREFSEKNIAHEAKLEDTNRHTIIKWCTFCKDVCKRDLIDHPPLLGGLDEETLISRIVEIDEADLFRQKSFSGHEGHSVFAGVDCESGHCFLVEMPDRRPETLSAIIENYILPGSIIISDKRNEYCNINQIGGGLYEHQLFDDYPFNPSVHGTNIDNFWLRAKRYIREKIPVSETVFTSHLNEFVWRDKFKHSNYFNEFIICVKNQYK